MSTTREKEQALEEGLVQTIFRPCARFLVEHAKPQAGERLLDVGCGSGVVARVGLDLQPALSVAHGFDYEEAAVEVAQMAASRHHSKDKLEFWRGDATKPEAYRGQWDICIAQFLVQHAPEMLTPMRRALTERGRAIIATWPATSAECPAYSFLYLAAGEKEKPIGMSMAALCRLVHEAGFRDITQLAAAIETPRITPRAFLRQYLEGKHNRPANIEMYLDRPEVKRLADSKASSQHDDASMQFRIAMNVVIASI